MKRGGTVMSKKLREEVGQDPEYSRCALQGLLEGVIGQCHGRVTREHAIYFAGRKLQIRWAIPPICSKHHGVDQYQDGGTAIKEIRVWVALNRATEDELYAISKVTDYRRELQRLNRKYGAYVAPPVPAMALVAPLVPFRNVRATPKADERAVEAKRFARANGCSLEAAEIMLNELV